MITRNLKLTRVCTTGLAVAAYPVLRVVVDPAFANAFLAAALWAVAGFWLIELLVGVALLPPGSARPRRRVALLTAGKLVLYAVGVIALIRGLVQPYGALAGFSLLLVVLVVTNFAGASRRMRTPAGGRDGDD